MLNVISLFGSALFFSSEKLHRVALPVDSAKKGLHFSDNGLGLTFSALFLFVWVLSLDNHQ